jgi:pSer/pThr/pTyr-binding forkhead associated (FHA) protein
MAERLLAYAQRLISNRAALVGQLVNPLLLWDSGDALADNFLLGTEAGGAPVTAKPGQAVVLEAKKGDKPNPFTMGITVGRSQSNDVSFPHRSVSRFHAYFRQDPKGQWTLVDAESKNGTWIGALKLKPNRPEQVTDRVRLKFGSIEVQWLLPPSFLQELEARMSKAPVPKNL